MAFFGGFLDASPFHPFIYTLIFWYMKDIQEAPIWAKFHLCLICSSLVFKFQMFSYQQKVPFQAASRWFFVGNPLECGQIYSKFCLPMQCEVMHQIFDSFYSIVKKWSKLGQKLTFLLIFRGFPFTPCYALGLCPNFLPNKRSLEDT